MFQNKKLLHTVGNIDYEIGKYYKHDKGNNKKISNLCTKFLGFLEEINEIEIAVKDKDDTDEDADKDLYEEMYIIEGEEVENILPDMYFEPPTPIFKCSICTNIYDEKSDLTAHIKDHFKTYECPICSKKLIGDTQYEYHINNAHSEERSSIKSSIAHGTQNTYEEKLVISKLFKKSASEKPKMRKRTEPATAKLPTEVPDTKQFVACDICGRICQNEKAVSLHRLTHNDNKDFVCDFCGKSFTRKTNLEFHIRIHTGERPFKCQKCPKAFAHVSGLNCHNRTHTGERPYKCPYCEKCYAHSTDLRRHRRSHGREEKRFECEICNRKFFEKKFLLNHNKIHEKHFDQLPTGKTILIKMEVQKQSESDEYTEEYSESLI